MMAVAGVLLCSVMASRTKHSQLLWEEQPDGIIIEPALTTLSPPINLFYPPDKISKAIPRRFVPDDVIIPVRITQSNSYDYILILRNIQ